MKDGKLEVGDKIAQYYSGRPQRIITVERVTNAQAICGTTKLKRTARGEDLWLDGIGEGKWSQASYFVLTPKIQEEFKVASLRNTAKTILNGIEVRNIPDEKIELFVNGLNELLEKTKPWG